ncbi:MAG: Bug family tripartite tricarboxylate transporter substrate binding protein [Xanthobacteraceae bacterium]
MAIVIVELVLAAYGQAQSATDYPTRPVRISVAYGAGGIGDLTVRIVAQKLSENVKQQFVIENRPGAGGMIAMKSVLDGPADGYTLAEMGNGQAIAATLFNKLPYDVRRDFTPISVAASFPVLVAVSGDSPYHSLKDVVAAARESPGKLNLGAINPGSTQNLSAHLFRQIAAADFTIVPYRTTPDLVTALLRRDVDVGFDYYAGFEGSSDKLRIIATTGETRDPLLKDVPTAQESGFPQYVVTGWNGLAARFGTPADVVKVLNIEINRALAAPDVQEKSRRLGMDARGTTPEEMRDRMVRDIAKWRNVIEKAGIPKL